MTTATLGLVVDSSGVSAATPALEKMVAASQKAEAAAQSLGRASSGASGSLKQLQSATAGVDREVAAIASKAAPAAAALDRLGASAARAAAQSKSMGGSMSGLAAQFQDIGVTAYMGLSPALIGLQQGTQIAGQLEAAMANGGKASAVFAQAFASLLSPVSLVVIGLTAVAAAAIQMVDWVQVAKGALNGIADVLVDIAPYAVTAGAALALIYSPAIVSGLLGVAKAIWGIGAAILGTVGLPTLLIAGFVAMAAAAVIWRDDLAKMLGFDIVQAAQDGINIVIGIFVGAFNAVTGVWGVLPAVFADIFTMAMNGAIDIVQNGINGIIGPIRDLMASVGLEGPAMADLSGFKGQVTGAAAEAGKVISGAFNEAIGPDYVGAGIKFVQNAASGAADALRGLADSIKSTTEEDKKAAKEAKRQAEAYADIVMGAQQRIAASELEIATIGMTTEQINAQRYAQELLNEAANDNIDLTAAQTAELTGLGAAMAAAEAAADRLQQIYDFGKSVTQGFFSDLMSWLREGATLWEALGEAGMNALQKIADKALSMAADGIWDVLFNLGKSMIPGIVSGGGNGYIPGITGPSLVPSANGNVFQSPGLSAYSGMIINSPTIFPFARGAGLMGEAGPEAIMPLKRGSDGKLGVAAANGNQRQTVVNNVYNYAGAQVRQEQNTTGGVDTIIEAVEGRIKKNMARGEYRSFGVNPGMSRS